MCVAMYGDFTETYRIFIAYTEMEIHSTKQIHVFLGYKPQTDPQFVRLGYNWKVHFFYS